MEETEFLRGDGVRTPVYAQFLGNAYFRRHVHRLSVRCNQRQIIGMNLNIRITNTLEHSSLPRCRDHGFVVVLRSISHHQLRTDRCSAPRQCNSSGIAFNSLFNGAYRMNPGAFEGILPDGYFGIRIFDCNAFKIREFAERAVRNRNVPDVLLENKRLHIFKCSWSCKSVVVHHLAVHVRSQNSSVSILFGKNMDRKSVEILRQIPAELQTEIVNACSCAVFREMFFLNHLVVHFVHEHCIRVPGVCCGCAVAVGATDAQIDIRLTFLAGSIVASDVQGIPGQCIVQLVKCCIEIGFALRSVISEGIAVKTLRPAYAADIDQAVALRECFGAERIVVDRTQRTLDNSNPQCVGENAVV